MRNLSLPEGEAIAVQSRAGLAGPERSEPRSGALDGTAARSYAVSTVRGGGSIACVGLPQGLSEAENAPMCNVMVAWAGDWAGGRVRRR